VAAIREAVDPLQCLTKYCPLTIAHGQFVEGAKGVAATIRGSGATVRVQLRAVGALWRDEAAHGKYLITLDADLQNDPKMCRVVGGAKQCD